MADGIIARRSLAGRLRRAPAHFLMAYRMMRFCGRWTALRCAFHSTKCVIRG